MSPNTTTMPEGAARVPCVNICVLDSHGYCIGCYRTIEEIARWRSMSASEQWAVLRLLGERARDCAQPNPIDQL